ncbi:MAG: hypothetical protein ABI579_02475 [Candidatus Sumerlaeota bacterium]
MIAVVYFLVLLLVPYEVRIWVLGFLIASGFAQMILTIKCKSEKCFMIGCMVVFYSVIMVLSHIAYTIVSFHAFALYR